MPVLVDIPRLREIMDARGLDISGLSRQTGLSRQALYRFFQPDYQPIVKGFRALAEALGESPKALLCETNLEMEKWREIRNIIERASQGEARAFEILPSLICHLGKVPAQSRRTLSSAQHRLVVAAAEVADVLWGGSDCKKIIAHHKQFLKSSEAFFFGANVMTPERVIRETPKPMKRHLVFGAFDMSDFKRHSTIC